MTQKQVEAHTDGACLGNPGPGGWAALLRYRGKERELAGGESLTTNNRMAWTGDTRPIPEQLAKAADAGELVFHDCALHGNPSHSGIDDLEREYPAALLSRCRLYHYASAADGAALEARGHRIVRAGEVVPLADSTAQTAPMR